MEAPSSFRLGRHSLRMFLAYFFSSEVRMKPRSLFLSILALALLASCASRSDYAPRLDLLGDPAPVEGATQTIVISPDTKWVNVTGGDTVKFIVGDKAFAWSFSGPQSVSSFALNHVAPAGILNREVIAYVAPDPRYVGSDGDGDSSGMH
jgi:hypothetical protein